MKIEIGTGEELKDGELEISLTMRGKIDQVVSALVRGMPREALEELGAALTLEARKRLGNELVAATLDQDPLTPHARAVRQEIERGNLGRLKDGDAPAEPTVAEDLAADAAREKQR